METNLYVFADRKQLFWKAVFYFSQGILAVWLILKSLGIIQTPFWLEYGVPVSGVMLTFFGFYHSIERSIKQLSVGFATLGVKVDHIEKKVDYIGSKVDILDARVGRLEVKVDHLDKDVEFLKKRV